MRWGMSKVLVAGLMLALVVAGCGDDDAETGSAPPDPPIETVVTDDADDDSEGGDVAVDDLDCDALSDAHFTLGRSAQLLASLVSNAQFEAVADGVVDLDFGEVRMAVTALRPLDAVENPLGSVDEALDRFGRVTDLGAEAISSPDPESTRAFAEIQPLIDDSASFLGALGPVNYAFGEACNT